MSLIDFYNIYCDLKINQQATIDKFIVNSNISYKDIFDVSEKIYDISIEDSLLIQIKIIELNPKFFDERIRDRILLNVYYDGNLSIYNHLKKRINEIIDEDIKIYLKDMKESIEEKYMLIGLNIKNIDS